MARLPLQIGVQFLSDCEYYIQHAAANVGIGISTS